VSLELLEKALKAFENMKCKDTATIEEWANNDDNDIARLAGFEVDD
jgi:hypothetical protein